MGDFIPDIIAIHNSSTIARQRQFEWKPKEDITTYELTLCLPILLMVVQGCAWDMGALIECQPASVQRHWEEIK